MKKTNAVSNIKTVFVIDKSLIKIPSSVGSSLSTWNCAMEASFEYCRIVWDIFSDKLIRFIVSDLISHEPIGSWRKEEQNLAWIKSCFAKTSITNAKGSEVSIKHGIRAALETLTLCSVDQLEEQLESFADKSKVSNIGCVICLTSILEEDDIIETLECFVKTTITTINQRIIQDEKMNSHQLPIHHCDFLLINIFPDPPTLSALKQHPYFELSPLLSCELISVCANHQLINCLKRLVLKHFELASTTITSISFPSGLKTPQTPNKIEIFHPVAAHDCLSKMEFESSPYSFFMEKGCGYKTVVISGSPSPRIVNKLLSSTSLNCWRISPFINNKSFQDLTAFLLNSWSGRSLFFKLMLERDTNLTKLFMLAAYNGEVSLQQIDWLELKESIPVPIIQPREKGPLSSTPNAITELPTEETPVAPVCPEMKKTSALNVKKAIVHPSLPIPSLPIPSLPIPSSSSLVGLKKDSQTNIGEKQNTKWNAVSPKPKSAKSTEDPETRRKTEKTSTPSMNEDKIEQASKRRKTEVVNAATAQLATKKTAANDSTTHISCKQPKQAGDQGGSGCKDGQAPQFNKQKEPSQFIRSTNPGSWQVNIMKAASTNGTGIINRVNSTSLKVNPISAVSIGLDHSSKLPTPNPQPTVTPKPIDQKTKISGHPVTTKSTVKKDQDRLTAEKRSPSLDNATNKSLKSSNKTPVPKKVRSSLPTPSLISTKDTEKVLPPKDSPPISDPKKQEAVRMDDEKTVQEPRKVPICNPILPRAKKTVCSSSLSVAEVCADFGLQDVQVDVTIEDAIIQHGNDYQHYFSLVIPFIREANPFASYQRHARLLGAKWREFSARQQSRAYNFGKRAVLPGVAHTSEKIEAANLNTIAEITNEERAGFQQQIGHLNKEVTDIRSLVESLVAKSNTTGSLNSTSSSDTTGSAHAIPAPEVASKVVESSAASSSGSQASNTETVKEQPNSAKRVLNSVNQGTDDHPKIKSESDDDIQVLCVVHSASSIKQIRLLINLNVRWWEKSI